MIVSSLDRKSSQSPQRFRLCSNTWQTAVFGSTCYCARPRWGFQVRIARNFVVLADRIATKEPLVSGNIPGQSMLNFRVIFVEASQNFGYACMPVGHVGQATLH